MRSFITAVTISIIIVTTGVVLTAKIDTICTELSHGTQDIIKSLEDDNHAKALQITNEATKELKNNKLIMEATGNHEELMRIELAYLHTAEFIKKQQTGDALACLKEIKLLLTHLPGNLKVKLENIL